MTPRQIGQLRTALIAAVNAHLANGGKLIRGSYTLLADSSCRCPIACLTGDEIINGPGYCELMSQKMGFDISLKEMLEIIAGFDRRVDITPLNKMGAELRQHFQTSLYYH